MFKDFDLSSTREFYWSYTVMVGLTNSVNMADNPERIGLKYVETRS